MFPQDQQLPRHPPVGCLVVRSDDLFGALLSQWPRGKLTEVDIEIQGLITDRRQLGREFLDCRSRRIREPLRQLHSVSFGTHWLSDLDFLKGVTFEHDRF
jgi:hypothetical protein